MRISTSHQYSAFLSQIERSQSRMFEAMERVQTGKRFQVGSEDPSAARYSVDARALRTRIGQFRENLTTLKGRTAQEETSLAEVSTLMRRVRETAVRGAGLALDTSSREGLVREIEDMQARLVSVGNTKDAEGSFIFAGRALATKPFSVNGAALDFNGDDDPIFVEVQPGEAVRSNLAGAGTMFQEIYTTLETLKDHIRSGDVSAISNDDLIAIDAASESVTLARSGLGISLNRITDLDALHQRRLDDLDQRLSDNEEVDMTEAINDYKMAETAYSASLMVVSRGFQLSLMDFMR